MRTLSDKHRDAEAKEQIERAKASVSKEIDIKVDLETKKNEI